MGISVFRTNSNRRRSFKRLADNRERTSPSADKTRTQAPTERHDADKSRTQAPTERHDADMTSTQAPTERHDETNDNRAVIREIGSALRRIGDELNNRRFSR